MCSCLSLLFEKTLGVCPRVRSVIYETRREDAKLILAMLRHEVKRRKRLIDSLQEEKPRKDCLLQKVAPASPFCYVEYLRPENLGSPRSRRRPTA